MRARLRLTWQESMFSVWVTAITLVGTALVLVVGGLHVLDGTLTLGGLLVVVAYLGAVYGPLSAIAHTTGALQQARVSARRVREMLALAPEVLDAEDAIDASGIAGHVRVRGCPLRLRRQSADPRRHQLPGPAGRAGGARRPDRRGQDDHRQPHPALLRADLGPRADRWRGGVALRAAIVARADCSGATGARAFLRVDRRQHPLRPARGQRRRGGGGRAGGARGPLHPATAGRLPDTGRRSGRARCPVASGSDWESPAPCSRTRRSSSSTSRPPPSTRCRRRRCSRPSGTLRAGRTILVIAHRLSTIRDADRILVLHEGHLIAQGTHDELLQSNELYRRMCARLSVGKSLDEPESVDEVLKALA